MQRLGWLARPPLSVIAQQGMPLMHLSVRKRISATCSIRSSMTTSLEVQKRKQKERDTFSFRKTNTENFEVLRK